MSSTKKLYKKKIKKIYIKSRINDEVPPSGHQLQFTVQHTVKQVADFNDDEIIIL